MFDISEKTAREYTQKFRALAKKVDEPVMAMRHAFAYKLRGRGYRLGDEVAVWEIESPAEQENATDMFGLGGGY